VKIDPELLAKLAAEGRVTVRGVNLPALIAAPAVSARHPTVGKMTEAAFQRQVIDLARFRGWRVAHFRKVRVQRKNGQVYWETPVAADGEGFPDLELVRGRRLIKAELKSARAVRKTRGKGRSEAQELWRAAYLAAGIEYYTWEPADWPEIERVLA
jgi:hypothetical protein